MKRDKTKSSNEQNIKDKTRGIIAHLYRDYICDYIEKKNMMIYGIFKLKRRRKKLFII